MTDPLISIIIPAWNTEKYIKECLDSVLTQSFQNIEVIVLDDNSIDNTSGIIKDYQSQDDRIVFISKSNNDGPGKCRNIGIDRAQGKYITFVDSDDFLNDGTFEFLINNMTEINDVHIFNGRAFKDHDKSIVSDKYLTLCEEHFEYGRIKQKNLFNIYNCHSSCMKLYDRAFLLENHIRFPEGIYGEDVEFWIRCLVATDRIAYIPHFGYMRRYRNGSIMTSKSEKNIIDRINNLQSLLEITISKQWLHNFIRLSYLKVITYNAINSKNEKTIIHLSDTLRNISDKYYPEITNELVSVVIPVYNQISTIGKTVESILNQTYVNLEILVVDDGSEEDIKSELMKLKDRRIRYDKLPHKNANVARNHGIRMAQGRYIAMLDGDDQWKNNHLDSCLRMFKLFRTDGLYGSLMVRSASGEDYTVHAGFPKKGESMINYLLRTGFGAQTSTLFMTAESAKDIRWDETLNRHQDYDFVVRYSKKYTLTAKPDPTVIYCAATKQSKIDFYSCIRFIEENKKDIKHELYSNYNRNMLQLATRMGADQYVIDYYKKEATRYKEYLSFTHIEVK